MADAVEETAAQRQARIRREKREAKIKAGGSERLDKITKLSGRTPEMMRNDQPSPSSSPAPQPSQASPPSMPLMSNSDDPAQLQAQEEYIRAFLRAQEPQPEQPQQGQQEDDPMMKMLNMLLGGTDGSNPNRGGLPVPPDDISKATGLPPFLTNMFIGEESAPPTLADKQRARIWALVHVILSLLAGVYVVYMLSSSSMLFGPSPPAPATIRNPFLLFIMGELLVYTAQLVLVDQARPKGMWAWWQILKDVARDGSIIVFMMGAASWLSLYQ